MAGTPLYLEVKFHLRELIDAARVGDRLPTEAELAQDLRVSRTTVRKALADLEDEGLLVRRAGLGTFVLDRVAPDEQLGLGGLMESSFVAGERLQSEVDEFGPRRARDRVAAHLQVDPGERVLHYRRVIRRLSRVVTVADVNLVLDRPDLVAREDLERMPVFRLLAGLGVRPVHGWRTIRATTAAAGVAEMMELDTDRLVLESEVLEMDDRSNPLLFATCWYPGDLYRFRLTFTGRGVSSAFLEPMRRSG